MSIRHLFVILAAGLLMFPSTARSIPPNPARIGGSVTFINSVKVRSADNIRNLRTTQISDGAFTFRASRFDGTDFDPAASDTDGLNSQDLYVIDIPIYNAREQRGGALPGDTARVRVFMDGRELDVVSPPDGRFIVGNSGSIMTVDLVVQDAHDGEVLYTQSQLEKAVADAVEKWDVGADGVVDLREAIHALMISVGAAAPASSW